MITSDELTALWASQQVATPATPIERLIRHSLGRAWRGCKRRWWSRPRLPGASWCCPGRVASRSGWSLRPAWRPAAGRKRRRGTHARHDAGMSQPAEAVGCAEPVVPVEEGEKGPPSSKTVGFTPVQAGLFDVRRVV